jgi:hypothetical protein
MSEELGKDLDLEEAKATGEDAESADAVTPEGGKDKKRKDKKGGETKADDVEDDVKTPQGTNTAGLSEAVDRLFEGTEFSEEFKSSAVAVFEAAVHESVLAETATLEEKFESDLQEQVDATVEDHFQTFLPKFESDLQEQVDATVEELVEKVDQYLDYVVENWMSENQATVESNIKVEVAESLLDSIKGLVSEHNLEIDQEQIDHAAELEIELEEASIKYNEVVEQMIELKEAKSQAENEIAFKTVSEELTDTQAEKLRVLSEGISFDTVEDYSKKLEAIKANYFAEAATTVAEEETDLLQEETTEDVAPVLDASMQSYTQSLSRFSK